MLCVQVCQDESRSLLQIVHKSHKLQQIMAAVAVNADGEHCVCDSTLQCLPPNVHSDAASSDVSVAQYYLMQRSMLWHCTSCTAAGCW